MRVSPYLQQGSRCLASAVCLVPLGMVKAFLRPSMALQPVSLTLENSQAFSEVSNLFQTQNIFTALWIPFESFFNNFS